jgi:ribosomal protein S18 acetylase RimI-like enzyme
MTVSDRGVIRVADCRDIAPLSRLAVETYTDAFGHTMEPSDLAHHLETHLSPRCFGFMLEEDVVLVLEVESHLIGYVQFGDVQGSAGGASAGSQELRRLYIQRGYQNRGYGKLLMDAALRHPRLLNAEQVVLDVWERNYGAQRFYLRYGFRVVGSRPFSVESGAQMDRDLVMVRHRPSRQRVSEAGLLSTEAGVV